MAVLIDLDKEPGLSEPLRFVLNGVEYAIQEVTEECLDALVAHEKDARDREASTSETLNKSLEILTGQPAEIFEGIGIRKKRALLDAIQGAIANPLKRPGQKPRG